MAGLKRKFAQKLEALTTESAVAPTEQPADRSARKGPATGPGGMLAFQEEMNASNEELKSLRDRVQRFEASLQVVQLDPALVSVSKLANRHEASFDTPEFEALKADIAISKGNVQPVKVRPVPGKNDRYELVFGHRRHRACQALGLKVLAMVESVDDSQLFMAMDRENRAREDLSPFEQGLHYQRALELKIFPSIRAMAQALEISHSSISKSIALAELPGPVVAAFRSPLELQYRWGKAIADALKADEKGVLARARELSGRKAKPAGAIVTQVLCGQNRETVETKTMKLGKNGEATLIQQDGAVTVAFPKGALSARKVSQLSKLIEDFVAG